MEILTTQNSREECFKEMIACHSDYAYKIFRNPPEILRSKFLRRNPVVIMHNMAKKIPQGEEYDKYVIGLTRLASMTKDIPLVDMLVWWNSVGNFGLGEVIGPCDTEWKTEMIKIWSDPDYTTNTLD
jgi:hypothetical protein